MEYFGILGAVGFAFSCFCYSEINGFKSLKKE